MKTFGHHRPVRDDAGNILEHKPSPAAAVTQGELDGTFGADRGRRLVVTLDAGDLITLRPQRTTRRYQIRAADLLRHLMWCQVNREQLERARAGQRTQSPAPR